MPTITGGLKLLPTACHCLAGSNSPWKQPSFLQFGEMAKPVPGAADRDGVALRRARRRKEATYPELIRAGARARLVVLGMDVGAVGPKRLGRSSTCWRKHAWDQIPPCYSVAWKKRGGCGGTPSCRARQPGRSQLPFWNSEGMVLMGWPRPLLRSSVTSGTLACVGDALAFSSLPLQCWWREKEFSASNAVILPFWWPRSQWVWCDPAPAPPSVHCALHTSHFLVFHSTQFDVTLTLV